MEKEALESHSQKQEKASTSSPVIASQNKTNSSLAASSANSSSSKSPSFPAPKKQPNTLWVDLSSKLASNGKLTSDEYKKCLYCSARDHKLDFCPKKQTTVLPKGYGASCCSNHSSLKNKWSHNKQSSPMGYQVKSGEITRKLDKEPSLHWSSIYIHGSWSMLQQYLSGP